MVSTADHDEDEEDSQRCSIGRHLKIGKPSFDASADTTVVLTGKQCTAFNLRVHRVFEI
jgi:hypothetical protein